MNSINPPSFDSFKTPLVWNEDVYALGRDQGGDGKLFKYSISNNEWSVFSVPSSIYESNSVLLTYCSKLLLISGESMTVWEFSSNDFIFQRYCIKPVPPLSQQHFYNFIATSKDEYLIVVWYQTMNRPTPLLLIYNGRNWEFRQREPGIEMFRSASGYQCEMLVDSHAIVVIESSYSRNYVGVLKAPMPSFGEDEDKSVSLIDWKEFQVISFAEFNTLVCRSNYSTILHNQQLYFADSQGIIFMSFIQPPMLPVVWGNSGVNFQRAPYMVGLPDGTVLMIGMVEHQHESQMDIIKVSQKGNKLESRVYSILLVQPFYTSL